MKICIISHYPPIEGGISKYTNQTVELLIKEKIEVQVIPVETLYDSFSIVQNATKFSPDLVRLEFAISMYRLTSISIFIQLFILKKINKFKIAVNYHEVKTDTELLGFTGYFIYNLIRPLFNYVTVHTKEAETILISKCNYSSSIVKLVPHAIYLPEHKNNTKILNKSNEKIILFFGYIHIHKGIDILLDAYKLFLDKNPNYKKSTKVIIAGSVRKRKGLFRLFEFIDKKYYQSLILKSKNLKLKNNILFKGYVKEKDVSNLINNSYMIILPYISTEQSGVLNKVLPYKIPIVASKVGGLQETLQKTGVLVKPNNAKELSLKIEKLLIDKRYYRKVNESYSYLIYKLNPTLLLRKQLNFYKNSI